MKKNLIKKLLSQNESSKPKKKIKTHKYIEGEVITVEMNINSHQLVN